MEKFVDIIGYEGHYQISNYGRVKSLARIDSKNSGTRHHDKFLVEDVSHKMGYKRVSLCLNGVVKRLQVHRLVATTFIENPLKKPQINHIDHNPKNNHVTNLEWVSGKENMEHSSKAGRQEDCRKLGMLQAQENNQKRAEHKYKTILGIYFVKTYTKKPRGSTKRFIDYRCKACLAIYTVRSESRSVSNIGTALCPPCYKNNQDMEKLDEY